MISLLFVKKRIWSTIYIQVSIRSLLQSHQSKYLEKHFSSLDAGFAIWKEKRTKEKRRIIHEEKKIHFSLQILVRMLIITMSLRIASLSYHIQLHKNRIISETEYQITSLI